MQSDQPDDKNVLSLASETKPGGRILFAALTVLSAGLLLINGAQTEPGFDGDGWWNAPRNAPLFSLGLLFVCSLFASITAAPGKVAGLLNETLVALVLSAAFLSAIWLIPQIGYGLSVLIFAAICGLIAGYRGRRLLGVSVGMAILMLAIFRYALGLWFPRAALFKLTPWLEVIGGYI